MIADQNNTDRRRRKRSPIGTIDRSDPIGMHEIGWTVVQS